MEKERTPKAEEEHQRRQSVESRWGVRRKNKKKGVRITGTAEKHSCISELQKHLEIC